MEWEVPHLATGVAGENASSRSPWMDTTPAVGVFPAELLALIPVIMGGVPHEPARPIQSGQDRPSSDCVIAPAPGTGPLGRGATRSDCLLQ